MGEVVQSMKNPVIKARVFAIKYLYIKGEEGGVLEAGLDRKQSSRL